MEVFGAHVRGFCGKYIRSLCSFFRFCHPSTCTFITPTYLIVHVCAASWLQQTLFPALVFASSSAMAHSCQVCLLQSGSAKSLGNHCRRFPDGFCCPHMTSEESCMLYPQHVHGRCAVKVATQTRSNGMSLCILTKITPPPCQWSVGGWCIKTSTWRKHKQNQGFWNQCKVVFGEKTQFAAGSA